MVGMMITPTKKNDRLNCSMNGSIDADEDLGQDGQQGRRAEQHDDRDPTGPGRPAVLVGLARPRRGSRPGAELEDQRQAVADDQDDRHQHRFLGDRARRLVVRSSSAKMAGTNRPMRARTRSAAFETAILALKCCEPFLRPPISALRPRTSSRLPMIEPVSDALTTSIRPACRAKNAMISSAMLPNVALRMPADLRPGDRAKPLGRQPDHPGEPEDRRRRHDEQDRFVGVQAEVEDDRQRGSGRPSRSGRRATAARAGRGSAGRRAARWSSPNPIGTRSAR